MVPSRTRSPGRLAAKTAIEAIDPVLLREPVEFLFAEHYRLRAVLNHLEWVARAGSCEARAKVARMVRNFLRVDLAHHIADEEEGLFPLLRARCVSDDQIDVMLEILAAEHVADQDLARAVIEGLTVIAESPGAEAGPRFRSVVRAFIETQRRHLSWENALVLPLARQRLTDADLHRLGEGMASRHGLPYPEVADAPEMP